jgi:hypothetical protein
MEKLEFKGTKGKWIADLRSGCCAVYPKDRELDTNGCHSYDPRNIFYSSKDSEFNGSHWNMCKETQANAKLFAASKDLLEACQFFLENGENRHSIKKAKQAIEKALK